MKIIQINGWLGRLNGPLARFIAKESPDIICLQEALRPNGNDLPPLSDQYRYVDEIQATAKMTELFFTPAWGFKMAGITIDVGLAILSKFNLSDKQQFHVSNSYFVAEITQDYQRNTRVFQSASVQCGDRKISVANHQGYLAGEHASGDEVSAKLMEKVNRALSSLPHPLIFCGDLNVGPDTPTMAVLNSLGLRNLVAETETKTTLSSMHRAPEPDRLSVVCDYILISPDVKAKNFVVSEEIVSDHKALILEFDI
jgi:endonuclease/exonuclease/phosphatase family metal-dependent hydrolase